jgi:hypothetical protein
VVVLELRSVREIEEFVISLEPADRTG